MPPWRRGLLDRPSASAHIGLMLIQTETTPNPSTLKFLPGRPVMQAGTRDFATVPKTRRPRRWPRLSIRASRGVFFGRTSSPSPQRPGVEWRDLKPDILSILSTISRARHPCSGPASAAGSKWRGMRDYGEGSRPMPPLVAEIRELIETGFVRRSPRTAVDTCLSRFRNGTVYLALHGPARVALVDHDPEATGSRACSNIIVPERGRRGGLTAVAEPRRRHAEPCFSIHFRAAVRVEAWTLKRVKG